MDDFIRVGGLGAVSAALPRALRSFADIRIMLPGYRDIIEQLTHIQIVGRCPAFAEMPACSLGRAATKDGLPVYVLLCSQLYDRPGNPYGDEAGRDWPDNDIRFARFASAAAELAMGKLDKNWAADLIHANDWPASLVPAYLAWRGAKLPSILTIHNLAYQGLFPKDSLRRIGAPESSFHIDGVEFYDQVSFLKAGLVYASHLTTVSGTYAREITTAEFGCGLEGLLRLRSDAAELTGILNGIDELGPALLRPARPAVQRRRLGRQEGQCGLRAQAVRACGLARPDVRHRRAARAPEGHRPRAVGGRRDRRRRRADRGHRLRRAGARAGPDRRASPPPRRHRGRDRFNDAQARRIFAGSDFTLMPSRFEPCGLSQMYAQRFGSLPIGHQTGGLAETITDGETGFLFSRPSRRSFLGGVRRAFSAFMAHDQLDTMRRSTMGRSFSWSISAGSYSALYRKLASV